MDQWRPLQMSLVPLHFLRELSLLSSSSTTKITFNRFPLTKPPLSPSCSFLKQEDKYSQWFLYQLRESLMIYFLSRYRKALVKILIYTSKFHALYILIQVIICIMKCLSRWLTESLNRGLCGIRSYHISSVENGEKMRGVSISPPCFHCQVKNNMAVVQIHHSKCWFSRKSVFIIYDW